MIAAAGRRKVIVLASAVDQEKQSDVLVHHVDGRRIDDANRETSKVRGRADQTRGLLQLKRAEARQAADMQRGGMCSAWSTLV